MREKIYLKIIETILKYSDGARKKESIDIVNEATSQILRIVIDDVAISLSDNQVECLEMINKLEHDLS